MLAHAGQDCGQQSTTRLHFTADKLVQMTIGMYEEPKRLAKKIPALGLRLGSYSFRLHVERDVPSFRIAKCKTSNTNLSNFHAVLLYFLCSPAKEWGSQHKAAWSCLWEAVARMLKAVLGKRAVQEEALSATIGSLGEVVVQKVRNEGYAKVLVLAHTGLDCGQQSTTRLHFTADKLVQRTMDMHEEPKRLAVKISALGLRLLSNSFRLQEERDVLPCRTAKYRTSNYVISITQGYGFEGDVGRALHILEEMNSDGKYKPDEIMYNSVLDGRAEQHRTEGALKVLDEMKEGTSATLATDLTHSAMVSYPYCLSGLSVSPGAPGGVGPGGSGGLGGLAVPHVSWVVVVSDLAALAARSETTFPHGNVLLRPGPPWPPCTSWPGRSGVPWVLSLLVCWVLSVVVVVRCGVFVGFVVCFAVCSALLLGGHLCRSCARAGKVSPSARGFFCAGPVRELRTNTAASARRGRDKKKNGAGSGAVDYRTEWR